MKRELTLGTPAVPVLRVSAERIRELLNRVLPRECEIKTAQDAWYVAAIGAACVTLTFSVIKEFLVIEKSFPDCLYGDNLGLFQDG